MEYLENRTFDEIQIGDTASLTRTLGEKDIQVFAIMSGDINPAHVDEEYAQSEMFHKIIGHGMWGGALISTVLGTQLPGPGTIYVGQTIRFKKPVGIGDTLTVKVTAIEKIPEKKRVIFSCECRNQKDEVVMEGQAEVIAPTKKIRRPKTELPEISLRRPYSLFKDYVVKAKALGALRAGVIFPIHEKIIEAVHDAQQSGLIDPMLIGPKERILHAAEMAKIDVSGYEIINVENSHAAINRTITLAREGEIGIIIRGGAIKEDLLRVMQKPDKGLLTERALSYALVLDVPTYPKALILTDTFIHPDPHLEVKRSITQNAIDFALALGVEEPKVAILAGSDIVSATLRSTVDAAALCKMAERGQIQGGILDGPLTFDNVISAEVAKAKGIESPVIGKADILVVPNLETGSILAKQLEYLAESRNAGLVLGGRVPVLMSHIHDIRLSTVSCALAILNNDYHRRRAEQR
ncbi:bifunctional enoyl-CoA hydratase/phosphate acetyltransferase [Aquicella lusitana]|uniref:Phosphate acetyltransferase/phosphate butyryltransferase n=1 Tax=Aquicella lusitana TaxID=254246 RepID=A0A370GAK8_9COXI|nr:bifunctional enoyl-CoA hydratase/phosphate acetyltransferase [Aquicella lusitana]RDI40079.1 phosphate acetyltransferase/phosphate butyryltransferase [Aquicella lusitana]VVC72359.1 Phosphate acetyltransferase [Aquicella lusitana]